ncbi:putative carboxylesterase 17 [Ananas comosus]|uniref:Putative carboxylesterase 17 n=1 Tax=Ananas comosus TaxID=4615 RepID=A0A199W4A0_ANACO|nr:putative carboxylesterase 17 [Ananas comosus]
MGAIHVGESNPRVGFQTQGKGHGHVVEEIEGLIRLYKDGRVDRLPAVADVPCTWALGPDLMSWDSALDNSTTGVWARIYAPKLPGKLPLLVYFHGGGFCVGSAAWSCYHEFLVQLATTAGCVIVSVNYRLAPEHRLPAAYQDGIAAMTWVRQQASGGWWRSHVDFDRAFLCGDSAGAAVAFNAAVQLGPSAGLRGLILIQPFFGGESRTAAERNSVQSAARSALTLAASDAYWRMALPAGASREHPWCNPLSRGSPWVEQLRIPPMLVCISEMDILKDRNLEFCKALRGAGKSVEQVVYGGVGHAFQILHNFYHLSKPRTHELLTHIKGFVNSR